MCTVTLLRTSENDFILTSNRDEAPDRITFPPRIYSEENRLMLYPKDSRAGGTWIGMSDKNRLVCVLNGAFEKHKRRPPYSKSRGQIAKSLLVSDNLEFAFNDITLEQVEPFTMIIVDWNPEIEVFEWVWDSNSKYLNKITASEKIWSSSSLYDSEMKKARTEWFSNFLLKSGKDHDSIWNFHHQAGNEFPEYGVIMDRGFVCTTSVTQVVKSGSDLTMRYEDLQAGHTTEIPFKIPELRNG